MKVLQGFWTGFVILELGNGANTKFSSWELSSLAICGSKTISLELEGILSSPVGTQCKNLALCLTKSGGNWTQCGDSWGIVSQLFHLQSVFVSFIVLA